MLWCGLKKKLKTENYDSAHRRPIGEQLVFGKTTVRNDKYKIFFAGLGSYRLLPIRACNPIKTGRRRRTRVNVTSGTRQTVGSITDPSNWKTKKNPLIEWSLSPVWRSGEGKEVLSKTSPEYKKKRSRPARNLTRRQFCRTKQRDVTFQHESYSRNKKCTLDLTLFVSCCHQYTFILLTVVNLNY